MKLWCADNLIAMKVIIDLDLFAQGGKSTKTAAAVEDVALIDPVAIEATPVLPSAAAGTANMDPEKEKDELQKNQVEATEEKHKEDIEAEDKKPDDEDNEDKSKAEDKKPDHEEEDKSKAEDKKPDDVKIENKEEGSPEAEDKKPDDDKKIENKEDNPEAAEEKEHGRPAQEQGKRSLSSSDDVVSPAKMPRAIADAEADGLSPSPAKGASSGSNASGAGFLKHSTVPERMSVLLRKWLVDAGRDAPTMPNRELIMCKLHTEARRWVDGSIGIGLFVAGLGWLAGWPGWGGRGCVVGQVVLR